MAYQLNLFWLAVMFFTRLPVPKSVGYSDEMLNEASRYFPWVGWLVGGIATAVYLITSQLLPHPLPILLATVATILATGAFHEDGLADACDGFGGGWSKEQVLAIMKDSRLGTYGAVGIGLVLATKVVALSHLPSGWMPIALWVGHSGSRFVASALIYTHVYVREDALSKAKPLAQKMTGWELGVAAVGGLWPLWWLGWLGLWLWPVLALSWWGHGRYFKKRLGGYTGDCLGATQQVSEVVLYLFLVALVV